jgi:hypothetical protein
MSSHLCPVSPNHTMSAYCEVVRAARIKGKRVKFISYHHIITRCRNPIGFLPEVWSPLQATVHLCGIFDLPWHRRSGTRDHVFSLFRQTHFVFTYSQVFFVVFFCMCPGRDRTRSLTLFRIVSQAC